MKYPGQASAYPADGGEGAAVHAHGPEQERTRERVARSILEEGPLTAAALAARLGVTPAAVRRHLEALVADGLVEPRRQRTPGPRGRGRPARAFALTDAGRDAFPQAYDDVAVRALSYIRETGGDEAVTAFARRLVAGVESRFRTVGAAPAGGTGTTALAEVLTEEGYVASVEPVGNGEQLCQHHCPMAHVAERFPQLCEAETEAFARILGRHVQRLATIAHGDGVCTTHIPGQVPDPELAGTTGRTQRSGPTGRMAS